MRLLYDSKNTDRIGLDIDSDFVVREIELCNFYPVPYFETSESRQANDCSHLCP